MHHYICRGHRTFGIPKVALYSCILVLSNVLERNEHFLFVLQSECCSNINRLKEYQLVDHSPLKVLPLVVICCCCCCCCVSFSWFKNAIVNICLAAFVVHIYRNINIYIVMPQMHVLFTVSLIVYVFALAECHLVH